MRERFDIHVSGGGIAGMTAAAAFGAAGFSVLITDPTPPVTDREDPGADRRSTAFLQPARATLERAGLWQRLAPFAAPLQIMRLADAGGSPPGEIRAIADFDASEISDQPFGWNLPNWLLRREISARLAELPNVSFRPGCGTARITPRWNETLITLDDGSHAAAALVTAADGRNSPIRASLGIGVTRHGYGQRGIVFCVRHPRDSEGISTEIHRSGGPFTLVPLPDGPKGPESAVVWMERADRAEQLMSLDAAAFSRAATERSGHQLGELTLSSPRAIWPIICQHARSLTGERCALIAEAAHVVPPIGAQGLNMSLADIETLLTLASARPDDLGSAAMLDRYARIRMPDILARIHGVDALNRAAMAESENLRALRLKGLQWLHGLTPLRQTAMRAGLGTARP